MSSMLNLPGSIIRGVGNVVGGTVSGVANATGISRHRSEAGEMTLKEKCVLNVKVLVVLYVVLILYFILHDLCQQETPPKDASSTGNLAIHSGFLKKRNEQGIWQRRYCCMVPHMFLYYFDNETAESPRGIIDLEYFTDVDIQSENILKLSTPPYINSRCGIMSNIPISKLITINQTVFLSNRRSHNYE
jgi:hypothetical protein